MSKNSCLSKQVGDFFQTLRPSHKVLTLKHIFQKEEQDRIEKVRLERIELLHQQASAKNLDKTLLKVSIFVHKYYKNDKVYKNTVKFGIKELFGHRKIVH